MWPIDGLRSDYSRGMSETGDKPGTREADERCCFGAEATRCFAGRSGVIRTARRGGCGGRPSVPHLRVQQHFG
eukprot:366230-Chlamydomonas_euryale.AAC.5